MQVHSINQQNCLNQNFKAGKIVIEKGLKYSNAKAAQNITKNLEANPTYKKFIKLFDAKFEVYTRISTFGDFIAGFDVNYNKIDPSKNKLQRFFMKLRNKQFSQGNNFKGEVSDWRGCDVAATNLSEYLTDNEFGLYKKLEEIMAEHKDPQ